MPDAGMGGAARPALRTGLGGPRACRAPGRDVDLRNGDGEALCFALVCSASGRWRLVFVSLGKEAAPGHPGRVQTGSGARQSTA